MTVPVFGKSRYPRGRTRLETPAARRALAAGSVLGYAPQSPPRWWIEQGGVCQYRLSGAVYLALLDELVWIARRGPWPLGRYYYRLRSASQNEIEMPSREEP
jgi:hypothetical protein